MAMTSSMQVECEAVWNLPACVSALLLSSHVSLTNIVCWVSLWVATILIVWFVRFSLSDKVVLSWLIIVEVLMSGNHLAIINTNQIASILACSCSTEKESLASFVSNAQVIACGNSLSWGGWKSPNTGGTNGSSICVAISILQKKSCWLFLKVWETLGSCHHVKIDGCCDTS